MESLLLDFLKVTELAAVSAFPWIGSGDENSADDAATTTMRDILNGIEMDSRIVIGEGEIDNAPMLDIGEVLGKGGKCKVDIAVDPLEGTTPIVNGKENGISVIAVARKNTLLHAPDMYMKKMAVGPKAKGAIDLEAPLEENMMNVAKALDKRIEELNIYIQDRPRHQEIVNRIRKIGAKVHLFNDGDVIYTVSTCLDTNVDMFLGIGGAPEGVLGAVGIRALGGDMQAKLLPRNEEEINRCREMGIADVDAVLGIHDLVRTDKCVFIATGITDNLIVDGIEVTDSKMYTSSILIDGRDHQIRYIRSVYPNHTSRQSKVKL